MKTLWYDTVDSTNAEAWRRSGELENLTVIAARSQTAGRGQRGNTWTSAPGENLTFSILLRHPADFPASGLIRVNWLTALSVRDFLAGFGINATIKWPNDIYVGRRKICGILIENRLTPPLSVIGIGLNVNQTEFPVELLNPVSIKMLTGVSTDLEKALECFLTQFITLLSNALNVISDTRTVIPGSTAPAVIPGSTAPAVIPGSTGNLPRDPLRARYEAALFQKGVPAPYRDLRTGECFTGTILGVDDEGQLRVAVEISPRGSSILGRNDSSAVGRNDNVIPSVAKESETTVVRSFGFKDIGYIL